MNEYMEICRNDFSPSARPSLDCSCVDLLRSVLKIDCVSDLKMEHSEIG